MESSEPFVIQQASLLAQHFFRLLIHLSKCVESDDQPYDNANCAIQAICPIVSICFDDSTHTANDNQEVYNLEGGKWVFEDCI